VKSDVALSTLNDSDMRSEPIDGGTDERPAIVGVAHLGAADLDPRRQLGGSF
jgi:hypothetical protein